ncbi:MAG TPA: hypothetical protein VNJ28_00650 [Candidatus Limnocylindrales bacterium]|nr:hypothetical protein [Candidatus Limnocylindrales bacterium]
MTPTDRIRLVERIERAQRDDPFCPACGEPTAPVARSDALWLECISLCERPSGLAGLLRLDLRGHLRRWIADLPAASAA